MSLPHGILTAPTYPTAWRDCVGIAGRLLLDCPNLDLNFPNPYCRLGDRAPLH
jgi:hypothetical protein